MCSDAHAGTSFTGSANLLLCFDSQVNGENTKATYTIGELEQWCLCTLGYLKSFSRQYATEVIAGVGSCLS